MCCKDVMKKTKLQKDTSLKSKEIKNICNNSLNVCLFLSAKHDNYFISTLLPCSKAVTYSNSYVNYFWLLCKIFTQSETQLI